MTKNEREDERGGRTWLSRKDGETDSHHVMSSLKSSFILKSFFCVSCLYISSRMCSVSTKARMRMSFGDEENLKEKDWQTLFWSHLSLSSLFSRFIDFASFALHLSCSCLASLVYLWYWLQSQKRSWKEGHLNKSYIKGQEDRSFKLHFPLKKEISSVFYIKVVLTTKHLSPFFFMIHLLSCNFSDILEPSSWSWP